MEKQKEREGEGANNAKATWKNHKESYFFYICTYTQAHTHILTEVNEVTPLGLTEP